MRTFKLSRAGYDWDSESGNLCLCIDGLESLIHIPKEADTIWVTLSRRKPRGVDALRVEVSKDKECGAIVDGEDMPLWDWSHQMLEEFGLPCWARIEYASRD